MTNFKEHEAWSQALAERYGEAAATAFVTGSDELLTHLNDDLHVLSSMPMGTHIGELQRSILSEMLPQQFLMNYNYEFLYAMRATLLRMRSAPPVVQEDIRSVLKEMTLYVVAQCAYGFDDTGWVFDIFGDMDVLCLFDEKIYIGKDHTYHFDNWFTVD